MPPSSPDDSVGSAELASLAAAVSSVTSLTLAEVQRLTPIQRKARMASLRTAIDSLEVAFDATVSVSDTAGDGQLLDGATTTAAWLRHSLNLAPREAAQRVRTARATGHGDAPAAAAAAAVMDGVITYPHLQVIASTLADLSDLPPETQERAVTLLVDLATRVDPGGLRGACRHLRYVLDPDRGQADHERQANARRASLAPLLDGTWRLEMLTTAEGGALLNQLLAAGGAPTSADDPRTPSQRRHDALLDALEVAAQSDALPVSNGVTTQILVTAPPQAFLPTGDRLGAARDAADQTGWKPARFADGTPIPGTLFDRLACNPTLMRVLQEPSGRVLDVGRANRFFTPAQRTALWARDHGCRFPGCSAVWTHAHHITPWQQGGATDLNNGVLLCGHHHRAVHDGSWTIIAGPAGADAAITFANRQRLTRHRSPIPPPDPLAQE